LSGSSLKSSSKTQIFHYLLFAVLVYFSWHWPGTSTGAILAIAASLHLALFTYNSQFNSNSKLSYKHIYLTGCLVNILGFNWLAATVSVFGGFPSWLGWIVFALFVVLSALQFSLFAFLYNNLPKFLGAFKLALAWVCAEFVFPRIFPWELSTPLVAIPLLSQIADIAGSYFVTFVSLSCCYLLIAAIHSKKLNSSSLLCFTVLLSGWLAYGYLVTNNFENTGTEKLKVALIQANVEVVQQGDIATIKLNQKRYLELSRNLKEAVDLIIWPEAVIQDWLHIDTQHAKNDTRIPFFANNTNFLSGALTFESQERFFNSAILVRADGSIPSPYHKRILMPFGEYMPFSQVFPWLNDINKNLALFTAGEKAEVFRLNTQAGQNASFSTLICYEDLVPRLSQESVLAGAQLLINLTNDAWFGDGPAAVHHSLISRYRAIENKRYLIRSTNTGLTEIIDPIGRSIGSIPVDSEGILIREVALMRTTTFFSDFVSTSFLWIVGIVSVLVSTLNRRNLRS
jgi:apolipoprotein N-acyltransferase